MPQKKLIIVGWDSPTTAQFRRDLAQMEKLPFDGTPIWVQAKGDNFPDGFNSTPFRTGFSRIPWKREWFTHAITDLQATKKVKTPLTDNFLRFDCNPGDVDWFDDAGWDAIVGHCKMAAWIAKEGGIKGIIFDAEPYTKPYYPFDYKCQKNTERRSFDAYRAKARERGKQTMLAMGAEFPDITILTFFMHSYLIDSSRYHGPKVVGKDINTHKALFLHSYGLYDAFLDGWLDALPAKATLIDGNEHGYDYIKDSEFFDIVRKVKEYAPQLVSAKNKNKCATQVQMGSAIYLDAHVKGLQPPYELPETGTTPLEKHTAAALSSVDSYVWLYGEMGSWWPDPKDLREWPKKTHEMPWETRLPGITEALRRAKTRLIAPVYSKPIVPKIPHVTLPKDASNLLKNGDFKDGPTEAARPGASSDWGTAGAPAHWSYWQDEFSKGRFDWDETQTAALAREVKTGVFLQSVPCKPGAIYRVTARAKVTGIGAATLSIAWKQDDSHWLTGRPETVIIQPQWTDKSGYEWYEAIVTAPAGAGLLICQLGVNGLPTMQDSILWKDAQVCKI
jgi:hypothetical protein